MILSSCDSRNLNLSPFCNLSSTSLAMWQLRVLETYGNQTTSYVNKIQTPMRLRYPNSMGEEELITSLTKVGLAILSDKHIIRKYNPCHLLNSFGMFLLSFSIWYFIFWKLTVWLSLCQFWNQSFLANFLFKFQFVRTNKKPNGNSRLWSFFL